LAAANALAAVASNGVTVALGRGRRRREEKIGRAGLAELGAGAAAAVKAGLEGRTGEKGDANAASSSRRRGCWTGSEDHSAEGQEEEVDDDVKGSRGNSKRRTNARYPAAAARRPARTRRFFRGAGCGMAGGEG
jgi:hypothetical protein